MNSISVTSNASPEGHLRISVIVTNYNYGHFLGACLDSLRAQTRLADEVIVVDDGSEDGSRAYLAEQTDVTVILQENGGQAAAFNTGFAACTGDAVLFLDADDVLNPEALSVIDTLWSDKFSGLYWAMDLINAQGAKTGRYPMRVPDIDLLPRMLDGLTVPFMPTSGNVFSRSAIAWAFPLAQEHWRISADAILIRAAILAGPFKGLPHTLGGYRIHGANNYYRGENSLPANTQRGLLDVVKSGFDLLDAVRRSGRPVPDGFAAKVLASILRQHLRADAMAPDAARRARFLRAFAQAAWNERIGVGALASAVSVALPWSKELERWITEPLRRPRWVQTVISVFLGRAYTEARYSEVAERAPFGGAPKPGAIAGELPLVDYLASPVWERKWPEASYELRASRGSFTITRTPGVEARLRLWLTASAPEGANVRIYANGLILARRYIKEETEVVLTLLPIEPAQWQPDRIVIEVDDARKRKAPGRRMLGSRRVTLRRMVLMTKWPPGPDAVLPIAGNLPVQNLGAVLRGGNGAVLDADHTLIGPGEQLSLAMPALPPPYSLAMKFAPEQGLGDVSINAAGHALLTGQIGPSQEITCFLPPGFSARERIGVEFTFQPEDPLEGAEVSLASLSWVPGRVPWINPGERVGPGAGRSLHGVMGDGWRIEQSGAATLIGPVGELALKVPLTDGLAGLTTVKLDLEALAPNAPETPPLVVVTLQEAPVAELRLAGRAEIDVAIPGGSRAELAIHVAGVAEDGSVGGHHGGIVLHGLCVASDAAAKPYPPEPEVRPTDPLALLREGQTTPDLSAGLSAMISATSPKALWHLLEPDDLERLHALGLRSPQQVPGAFDGAKDWLKQFALTLLSGGDLSAFTLAQVPDLPEAFIPPVSKHLVQDPGPLAPREVLATYQQHLAARLEEAREIFATYPNRSVRRTLANQVIMHTRANGLLFSDLNLKPHVAAFGRALEARLTAEGNVLDLVDAPTPRIGDRPRVGIIVRDLAPVPETWILKGLLEALPQERADVTVYLTQGTGETVEPLGSDVVSLAGLSVAAIVSRIRAARLDTVLLGAAFHGFMPDAEIAAHRLAPRQITFAATQYATTGLRSVDEMVFGELQAPKEAQEDCTEQVVLGPGTGQIFRFGAGASAGGGNRQKMRETLGLEKDAVMLTSGAMADKIGPEVLKAWVAILAQCDDAVLVLYPFAANWYRNYDHEGFAEAASTACVAAGVDPERVKILQPLGAEGVRDALAAADVYLVAFPYSGATTTVEALLAGLPTVARVETTQRGHQAASWLEEFGQGDCVGATTADYIKIAADLTASESSRQRVKKAVRAMSSRAIAQEPFCEWLADHVLGDAKYFFHHIPKTGGTSMRYILSDWFDVIHEENEPWGPYATPPVDLDSLTPKQLVTGHYAAPLDALFDRYPDITTRPDWRLMAFLREPLDRALSAYFFSISERPRHQPDYVPPTLDEFLPTQQGFYMDQFGACEANWREMLDRYWFIGTMERFPECVAYLAREMGKPAPDDLPTLNRTARKETPTEEAVSIFRARNAVDYAIYEEVNRRLDRLFNDKV